MTSQLVTVPCLTDNYAYLLHDEETGTTALIDAPEAAPIKAALAEQGWGIDLVLITHHHNDHVDGLADLIATFAPKVIGAKADAHRLPTLDVEVEEGDTIQIGALEGRVLDVSGHTLGHIAFVFEGANAVFSADSLMALGCGRLFEGTPAQMWDSLKKLRDLPGDMLVCSGHEYTQSNAKFALTIEPENEALQERAEEIRLAREEDKPTVPSLLSEERATNPFLRADLPEVKAAIGMVDASDVDVFAEIRSRKDNF